MLTDIAIAQNASPRPITDIARAAGLLEDEFESYGRTKAKIAFDALTRRQAVPDAPLVLVTAITPTPAGEGKTTTTVGLAQGLQKLGVDAIPALREPSLGPVFGMKGGAAGGGYAQLLPMEDLNLHFTGDLHAVGAANNLLAALIDNHLQSGNPLALEPRAVTWRRCLDMNDRSLRAIVTGLGGRSEGVPRETGFEITAASEVMAILCLSESLSDLTARLERIVIGRDLSENPVTVAQLGGAGAMTALLRDALRPNLVQTLEGTPAIVHGGPFANIAHGCSSVLATRMARKLGAVCVTEAGFGADLGAEKFCNIKMRQSGMAPDAAVLVATVRALKWHGGVDRDALQTPDVAALEAGCVNLERHVQNLEKLGLPIVVCVNRFASDTDAEIDALRRRCDALGLRSAVSDAWERGGDGATELAREVVQTLSSRAANFRPLYDDARPLREKITTVATQFYGAGQVLFAPEARRALTYMTKRGYGKLPVCIAKTQYSFSDDAERRGAPTGHTLTIRDARLSAGAGFVVAYAGTIMTLPGLPKHPAALDIACAPDGTISGLF